MLPAAYHLLPSTQRQDAHFHFDRATALSKSGSFGMEASGKRGDPEVAIRDKLRTLPRPL
ncbi:hypothetical protein QQ056_06060 [Oscillatoria laete-virens NRMC-F 0139]|nr:hypothetical protein [Oscillatoria laete-virens]MDL5053113.1 hypothetical protein [Oscillatoria laete-virens NRMC-F 0139]